MAQCVVVANVGGTDVLTPSSADPCTGLIVLTPAEYGVFSTNPLMLSAADGAVISGAVAGVWIAAWCMRALYSVLRGSDGIDAD